MTASCDGCGLSLEPKDLAIFMENGVQVRYCGDCATIWSEFERAHNATARRFQLMLDQWTATAREHLPLKVTPLDFPALAATPNGSLRLG